MDIDFNYIYGQIKDRLGNEGYDLDELSRTLLELVDEHRINIYEATQYLLDSEGSEELFQIFLDYPRFMWWFPNGMIDDIWHVPGVLEISDKAWRDTYGGQYEN